MNANTLRSYLLRKFNNSASVGSPRLICESANKVDGAILHVRIKLLMHLTGPNRDKTLLFCAMLTGRLATNRRLADGVALSLGKYEVWFIQHLPSGARFTLGRVGQFD